MAFKDKELQELSKTILDGAVRQVKPAQQTAQSPLLRQLLDKSRRTARR